jgi:hypothetical protein
MKYHIEKNGKTYVAMEKQTKWTLKADMGKITLSYEVPKADCKTLDELRKYVMKNDLL